LIKYLAKNAKPVSNIHWRIPMLKNVENALSPEACTYLSEIEKADIMVGIPAYNNVLTAAYVLSQVAKGLVTFFPNKKSVIFVSDGNSVDGTMTAVKAVQLPHELTLIPAIYVGVSGKGSAVKAIFEAAKFLGVKAVALVDSDLRSITPEWIKLLISPVLSGTGLVTPYYSRRKYDGTITDFLCYPVTFSLYGKDIRQPIGGDFGLSIDLILELLESSLWKLNYVREFGVDIFETSTALAKGFEVKQAFLGVKEHNPKDPATQLAPMFKQVVGTMFSCIERYEDYWRDISGGTCKVEMVGEERRIENHFTVPVNPLNAIRNYQNNFDNNRKIYRALLNNDIYTEFEELKNLDKKEIAPETWAKTVYSFAAGFKRAKADEREDLLEALRILWIGKVATFIQETLIMDAQETEEKIKEETKVFADVRHFLIDLF
jgi:glucosylglycerate synthase